MGELRITPENETQTREWFAAHIAEFEYSIIESGSAFPDYVLEDETGKKHRVEVESKSINFLLHRHDPDGCDFVLCWSHNAILAVPVLELSTRIWHKAGEIDRDKIDHSRDAGMRSRGNDTAAFMRQAAQEFASAERDEFFVRYADDLRARCKFIDSITEPRMRLLEATNDLVNTLRQNGVDVRVLHPEAIFALLVPKPRPPKVGTWDESASE